MSSWREQVAIILAAAAAAALLSWAARADMAPNFPPDAHPWLHQLYSPPRDGFPRGEHCCDPGDCWLVTYRIRPPTQEGDSGYQVFFADQWLNVPADRVVRRADNPTGNAVLCINAHSLHVYCFIPGGEG